MKHLKLKADDKKQILNNLNRVIGVIQSVKSDVENDHACEQTLTQIMAARGALASVGKNMVNKGVLECLSRYTKQELEEALVAMFKFS